MKKKKFYIYQEDLARYQISNDFVTITQFVNDLNEKFSRPNMKKLVTSQITNYLLKKGYLVIKENHKIPSVKGKILGICQKEIECKDGNFYLLNLYNRRAQRYLLDDFYEIIKENK